MDILATVLSLAGLTFAVISGQVKSIRRVLFFELFANLAMALNFLISSGLTGSLTCFAAALQTLFNYLYRRHQDNVPRWSLIFFSAVYLGIALLSWKGASSIFPLISIAIFELAVFSEVKSYRWLKFISNGAWIAYSLFLRDYSALFTYCTLFLSLLYSILRMSLSKRKSPAPSDDGAGNSL